MPSPSSTSTCSTIQTVEGAVVRSRSICSTTRNSTGHILSRLPSFMSISFRIRQINAARAFSVTTQFSLEPTACSTGKPFRVAHWTAFSNLPTVQKTLHVGKPTSIWLKTELCASKFTSSKTVDTLLTMFQTQKPSQMLLRT